MCLYYIKNHIILLIYLFKYPFNHDEPIYHSYLFDLNLIIYNLFIITIWIYN